MNSKNNTLSLSLSTHSVINTEKAYNGIESNPALNRMNVRGNVNTDTGEGASRTEGAGGSPCEVNSESTISTDKDESVFDKNELEGVV
jgi:hypothetical protein